MLHRLNEKGAHAIERRVLIEFRLFMGAGPGPVISCPDPATPRPPQKGVPYP